MAGTIVAGTLSDGTYSGSVTDTVRGACKARVNFNGTGTVAIRAAYNVSSIADNGTGLYTVNLTNALPDANYSVVGTGQKYDTNDDGNTVVTNGATSRTSTASTCPITTARVSAGVVGVVDVPVVSVAIFR